MNHQAVPTSKLAFATHTPLLLHPPHFITAAPLSHRPQTPTNNHPKPPNKPHPCIISTASNLPSKRPTRQRRRPVRKPHSAPTAPKSDADYASKVNTMFDKLGAAVSRTPTDERTVRNHLSKLVTAWDRTTPQFQHLVHAISGKETTLSDEQLFNIMYPHEQLPNSGLELHTDNETQTPHPNPDTSDSHHLRFDPASPATSPSPMHPTPRVDITALHRLHGYQPADPRRLTVGETKRRMENLRRRKNRLAVETGVDERVALRAALPVRGDVMDAFAYALPGLESKRMENVFAYSLSRARVVDFEQAVGSKRRCALTACASGLMAEVGRVPFVRKPFFGMQAAFEVVNCPPCPRCKAVCYADRPTDEESLCDNCYSEIYLEDGSLPHERAAVGPLDPESVAERKAAQDRAAVEAEAVTMGIMRAQAAGNVEKEGEAGGGAVGAVMNREKGVYSSNGSGDDDAKEPPVQGASRIGDGWNVRASDRSMRTINPIRNLVQNIDVKPNADKKLISLSVGDPTVYGNLNVSKQAVERFTEVIRSGKANGYTMSMGSVEARAAVAERYSSEASALTADDVTLTAGTSGALEIAIGAIANEGDNVLLPQPGFPLFRTISEGFGIECRFYRVNPEKNWEIELQDVMALADKRTAAIVVNNPSNPCGSVYSKSHIEDLLAMSSLLKLPIIADEVYADMVFSSERFTAMGSVASDVPVLSVGGISKQFVVPGWRLGWLVLHDRNKVLENGGVRKGIRQLTTRMLVPNTPAQMVVPTLLKNGVEDEGFVEVMRELEDNAKLMESKLGGIRGLRCIRPQGAMYVMVGVDVERLGLADDMEFTKKLLVEEAVFVLPGQCFQAPNFIRLVFSAPRSVLEEAMERMNAFCERHWQGE